MLRMLPDEILFVICMYLPTRSIAAVAIVYERVFNIIRSTMFKRNHFMKFEGIVEHFGLNIYKSRIAACTEHLTEFSPPFVSYRTTTEGSGFVSFCCKQDLYRTISNHCIPCLLSPELLLSPPEVCGCICVDHQWLWNQEIIPARNKEITCKI